jgi:EF hand
MRFTSGSHRPNVKEEGDMKINKTLLTALIVGACAANNAFAAPNKFTKSDANRDGALSRAEACIGRTPSVCKNFDRIDVNRDGVVSRSEVRAFNNAKRARRGLPPKP